MTNAFKLKRLNLYKVSYDDLSFTEPFKLNVVHNDRIEALATFFTVDFRSCHKMLTLTTSPYEPNTHWKQTVFYLKNFITVQTNESVYGTFKMTQNKSCKRDMDICIDICYSGVYAPINWTNLEYKIR